MSIPPPTGHRRWTIPRIKFIWGGSRTIQGRWYLGLFGFYDRVEGRREGGLAISVPGLVAWGCTLVVVGYVAVFTGLFWVWQGRPYNLLTYGDALLYPVRRAEVSAKRGQAYLTEGMDLWRAKKYHDAATMLRLGLARYPRDTRGRATLAQYYVLINRRPLALALLQEGLTKEYPGRAYLEAICDVAEQGEDYGLIIRICERFRPLVPADAARDQRWLQTKLYTAYVAAGRPADALALASAEPEWSEVAAEQRVLALLALDRPDDALKALAEWRARRGDVRIVTRLQVRALREAKRFDEMDKTIEELRQLNPTLPNPMVYGIVQRAMAGRAEPARAMLEDYLFRFAKTSAALQLVAEPLAEIGDLSLLERCATAASERGYPPQPFQVLLVQTLVQKGNWPAAVEILRKMPEPTGRSELTGKAWRSWMQKLIDAAVTPAEGPQVALLEFLRERPWPIKIIRKSAETMRVAGRLEAERDIVATAIVSFPESAWFQARKEEVARLLAARVAPAVAVTLPAGEARRWTERTYFARLDELVRAAKWSEVEALLTEGRDLRPPPDWLARRDDAIRLAQVRLGHAHGSMGEMLAAARIFLNGDAQRSNAMLDVAREFHTAGDRTTALTLAKEVQRKSPDYPPVQRLLAEWQPKPATK